MNYLTFKVQLDSWYHRYTIRKFLESFHLSKSSIYKYELHQALRLNGKEAKLYQLLKEEDVLEIDLAYFESTLPTPVEGKVEIIYEDADIVVVNKLAPCLVHTDGVSEHTLTNYLAAHYKAKNYLTPVLPAHRLDVETSGVMVFGAHPLAQSYLSMLFETQMVKKHYRCLVTGKLDPPSGVIETGIAKDRHENKQRVSNSGKTAVSTYNVIQFDQHISKLDVSIRGGRKHQIRVHLAHINHPIIGDKLYKGKQSERLMLHALSISFKHPRTHEEVTFTINEPF